MVTVKSIPEGVQADPFDVPCPLIETTQCEE